MSARRKVSKRPSATSAANGGERADERATRGEDARPTVYTVPPHEPFVDALAGGILSGRAVPLDPGDPLALSRLTILLPTRRACRALGLAFLRGAPGRALLLPRIRPLGDIDEDEMSIGDEDDATLPDAVSPLERRLLLARLIQRLGETPGGAALTGAGSVDQAARLAQALAGLLDEIQIARIDPQGLATLAPEEYAAHWQQVLRFLSLITDAGLRSWRSGARWTRLRAATPCWKVSRSAGPKRRRSIR